MQQMLVILEPKSKQWTFSVWKYFKSTDSSAGLRVKMFITNGTVFASAYHCMFLLDLMIWISQFQIFQKAGLYIATLFIKMSHMHLEIFFKFWTFVLWKKVDP